MTERLDLPSLQQALAGSVMRFEVRSYSQVGSTQDLVLAAAEAGSGEGLVVVADEQLAGRGRGGSRWISPAGTSLMLSVLFRPASAVENLSSLSLVAGLALVEGLDATGGPEVRLKWPNDCLSGDRKLAGVLAEARTTRDGERVVVLGLGCNLSWAGVEVPADLLGTATACDLTGHPVDRTALAGAVLARLATRYREWTLAGFEPLREDWLRHAAWVGEEVVAEGMSGQVRGRHVGISELGELLIETPEGRVAISAGEVERVGPQLRLAG